MQDINPDSLFAIFESNNYDERLDNRDHQTLNKIFIRIIKISRAYLGLKVKYNKDIEKFQNINIDAIENTCYSWIFSYINFISLNYLNDILGSYSTNIQNELVNILQDLLLYYQKYEEYEKCSIVKKVLNKLS